MASTKREPFHEFASESEMPLRSTRAKLFAIHVLLETGKDPGEESLDAVCHLIAETLSSVDRVLERYDAAYRRHQEARDAR